MADRRAEAGDFRRQRACVVRAGRPRRRQEGVMAEIVLGIGTSHGPMLSTPPEGWDLRVPDDRRSIHHFRGKTWTFEELVALRKDENLAAQITLDIWKARYAACRKAIDELARVFAE